MAQGEYISTHLGAQVDAAVNAVANKQDTLVSGTNIKTINQTSVLGSGNIAVQETLVSGTNIKTINNESILGSGNITIQGGGGDFNVRIVDATNPEDWDSSGEGVPSQATIEDVATGTYQAIRIINIPAGISGSNYELDMFLISLLDIEEDVQESIEETHMREYVRFDSGEDENDAAVQAFTFSKEGTDDAEMLVSNYELNSGSSGSGDIYFQTCELGGQDYDEVSLNLSEITQAIDNNKEVIIKVNGSYGHDARYFRIETLPQNGKTIINGDDYWTPTFHCIDNINEYYMDYKTYESEAFVFTIHEGAVKFAPTTIDIDTQTIVFGTDDYSYMFNKQPKHLTLNLDEDGGEFWVDFDKVVVDETPGEESYTYTSGIIPISTDLYMFVFRVYMNDGNIETEITAKQLTITTPV